MGKKIIAIMLTVAMLMSCMSVMAQDVTEECTPAEVDVEETVTEDVQEVEEIEQEESDQLDAELFAATTWQDATQLVAGAKTAFNLPVSGAIAWFRIDVENDNEAIKLSFDGFDNTSNEIKYDLYDGIEVENKTNPSSLASSESFKTDFQRSHKVNSAGSYYVKVRLNTNSKVLENDVNISYTIVSADSNENNDTWQNATELIKDVDTGYTLNGINDVDWFKISVANDTDAIKLVMSNFDYTVNDIDYFLYRGTDLENGNMYNIDSYTNFHVNYSRNYKVNEAGDYYVRVDMNNPSREWNEKVLKIRFEIVEGDGNENNETKETATYLTDSVPMEFTLSGDNDVDWFCFDTTMENETVTLTVEGFETDYSNEVNIVLYDGETENDIFAASTNRYYSRTASFIDVGTKYVKISVDGRDKIAENTLKITYSGGTGKKDFNEANNTWQTATPLPKDTEVQFNLPATSDTDWFVIDVENPDEGIELNFSGFQPGSDSIQYWMYSAEELNKHGDGAGSMYYYGTFNSAHHHVYKVSNAGKYYIRVSLYGKSITEYLNIKFSLIEPDEHENNDTWKKAVSIEEGVDVPFTINGDDDVDWFKIRVNNPDETICFNVSGFKSQSPSIYCRLYSEEDFIREGDNAVSLKAIDGFNRAVTEYYTVTNPGVYYIKLGAKYNDWIMDPLSVKYDIISPDEYENNNQWKKATSLQEGINKAFTLPSKNEEDWFKITANADEAIKLSFDGFETDSASVQYSLYSVYAFETEGDSASYIGHAEFSKAFSKSYKVDRSGDYYVRVWLKYYSSNNQPVLNPMTIKYEIESPDEYENNDSWENAVTLTRNQPLYHTLNGQNDEDYFKIENVTVGDTINLHYSGYKNDGGDNDTGHALLYYYDDEYEEYISVMGRTFIDAQGVHSYMSEYEGTFYLIIKSMYADCPDLKSNSIRYTISREDAPVEGISLNYSSITLNEGVTTSFVVDFEPVYATNQNVTWTSSNADIVSVDAYGNITCKAIGKATITAKSQDGGYTASCPVTVVPAIRVSGITLNKTEATVAYEGSIQLEATVAPEDATNQKVIWTSSDESVVTVNTKGKVVAVGHGDAVIKATTEDGGFEAECTIHVPEYSTAVRSVAVDTNAATIYIGDNMQFNAVITPSNATNTNVFWYSDDESVVTIDENGLATAVGLGTTTINVVTEEGGYTNSCTVVVEPQPVRVTGIRLSAQTLTMAIPGTNVLVATITPDNATNKVVKWTTSNPAVATVSSGGKVTAVGLGTAIITAETQDGAYTAQCTINVSTTALSGDVNYDGDIDAADALLVLRSDVRLTTLTAAQKKIADVNKDGTVDAADAILILKYNAGLIENLE